jgi:hypothetical protein
VSCKSSLVMGAMKNFWFENTLCARTFTISWSVRNFRHKQGSKRIKSKNAWRYYVTAAWNRKLNS